MTRKHFKAMAQQLLAVPDLTDRRVAAAAFIKVAMAANPRFDQAKFLAACGL